MRSVYRTKRVFRGKRHVLAVSIITGLLLAAMFGGMAVAWWHGHGHLFSLLFVGAVVTLAVAMTIARLNEEPMTVTAARQPATIATPAGSSTPPSAVDFYAGAP
jgi:putative effector of murein hydrolase